MASAAIRKKENRENRQEKIILTPPPHILDARAEAKFFAPQPPPTPNISFGLTSIDDYYSQSPCQTPNSDYSRQSSFGSFAETRKLSQGSSIDSNLTPITSTPRRRLDFNSTSSPEFPLSPISGDLSSTRMSSLDRPSSLRSLEESQDSSLLTSRDGSYKPPQTPLQRSNPLLRGLTFPPPPITPSSASFSSTPSGNNTSSAFFSYPSPGQYPPAPGTSYPPPPANTPSKKSLPLRSSSSLRPAPSPNDSLPPRVPRKMNTSATSSLSVVKDQERPPPVSDPVAASDLPVPEWSFDYLPTDDNFASPRIISIDGRVFSEYLNTKEAAMVAFYNSEEEKAFEEFPNTFKEQSPDERRPPAEILTDLCFHYAELADTLTLSVGKTLVNFSNYLHQAILYRKKSMTGRKSRVVSGHDGVQFESRSESDVPLEILNLTEKQRFMDGEKVARSNKRSNSAFAAVDCYNDSAQCREYNITNPPQISPYTKGLGYMKTSNKD